MSESDLAIGLAAIVVLGVGAQWLASRVRVPSILLLLLAGFLAGPVTGIVEPDEMFGDLLLPAVSLGVGFILFEGGLSLRYRRLQDLEGRISVLRLVTIGVAITWVLGSLAAWALLEVDKGTAAVLGAILVVSGPTVIIPVLLHVRPREPSAAILRWEAIVIDPIGALLAIVVLDAVIGDQGPGEAMRRVASTIGVGTAVGAL